MENKHLCSFNDNYKLDINYYHILNYNKNDIIPRDMKRNIRITF